MTEPKPYDAWQGPDPQAEARLRSSLGLPPKSEKTDDQQQGQQQGGQQ